MDKMNNVGKNAEGDPAAGKSPEIQKEPDALESLRANAKSGSLNEENKEYLDNLFRLLARPTLDEVAELVEKRMREKRGEKSIDPEKHEEEKKTGERLREIFSDKSAQKTIKEFALSAYEGEAERDEKSLSFEKLKICAEILGRFGDDEIAKRFYIVEEQKEPYEVQSKDLEKGVNWEVRIPAPPKVKYRKDSTNK